MTDMDQMDMNGCIENEDYFMQNEENAQQPKTKKLRKLVKKNKGQSSSDDENGKGYQSGDNNKSAHNTQSNEIDNNQFENKLLIEGKEDHDGNQKTTYKSKLDELSEQIALMDQEKQGKKQRKSNKKKNFSEDNEFLYLDDDEEKKIAEKSEKKTQRPKKIKEKIEVEKNEDMLKRLADKFKDEEDDNEDNYQANDNEDIDEDYEMNPESNKKKKNAKGANSKANQNAAVIKTNNKLFKEINTLEQTNLDNIEEQPVEEECLLEESIKFERQNNRNQKNLMGFLKQSMLYKKQRGIDYESSQNKLKERSQSYNASKSLAQLNNDEEQKEEIPITFSQNVDEKNSQNEIQENGIPIKINGSGNQSGDDSQKFVDFANIQRQISSTSIGVPSSQEKQLQLLKQSSQKIQKMLSFSQSQNLSQASNKLSQDDDLELDLQVPTVDKSQKHQSLINNTLFFNKIIRTNNQSLLMKQSSVNSVGSNSQILGSQSSQNNIPEQNKKKLFSRNEYLKQEQKRVTERKSQNLNMETVQNTFKQTSFDHLLTQKDKSKKESTKTTGSENGEEVEKTKNQTSTNDDDHENDSQNTENDSDYDPDKNSEAEGDDEKGKDMVDENESDKQKQLIEAEIQYRKLLALEEGIDEKEFERQIRLEYGLVNEEEDADNEDGEENDEDDEKEVDENNEEEEEVDLEKQLEAYEDEIDRLNNKNHKNDEMIAENEEERRPMRRLKNIAAEILKKQQEKKEKEKIRQQKEERRKELLNNPIMKKIMNEMIDDEAELGSDNEENDDKIKETGNDDEHREAGLNKDEDLDAELKELINNVVDFNEEHEQLAASKFIRDLAKRDKEEIKKIIEGAYKGTRAKRRNLSDLLEEEGDTSESKKLKRIQEAIKTLQDQTEENQYSDEEEEEEFDPITGGQKPSKSKSRRSGKEYDEEKEQIMLREANLLLKKEYEKVSGQNRFDEKKLVDSSILDLIQNKSVSANGNSSLAQVQNNNGALNSKKIIPTKISDKVGVMRGNLSFGQSQPSFAQQLVNQPKSTSQNAGGLNLNNLRGSNVKNSILHVKNNKNRFSQFNDSFNKESLLNEFGESALAKAFQNYADHSQSIFYSKSNNEDSNSKPLDKGNKLAKQSSSTQNITGSGSSSQNIKNISSINKLFKSSSVSSTGPSNQFGLFGKKKFASVSNDSKN